MPVDFRDASERHWDDAGHLFTHTRLANADHLFGLAAECALKAVMQGLGMAIRPDGAPTAKQHRVHINDLWYEFLIFAQYRRGAHYAAMLSGGQCPFDDWDVSQRYNHRRQFSQAAVIRHQQGAHMTIQVLQAALLNGDVS